jgi:phospholipid-transporting ATPase
VLFVMPQFWFGFYSAFSGQVFYEKWIYQIFNIVFTAFPIMIFALFDQEHLKKTLMEKPKYYRIGLKNQCFTTFIFWRWILYGIF